MKKFIIIFFVAFTSCRSVNNTIEKNFMIYISQRNVLEDTQLSNSLLSSDDIYGNIDNVFYEDSISKIYFLKKWRYLEKSITEIDFSKIRTQLKHPKGVLRDYLPEKSKHKTISYSKKQLLSNQNDRYKRDCIVFLSQPIFTHNSFGILYEESYCGPENGSGQLNIYYYQDEQWVLVGIYPTFVS